MSVVCGKTCVSGLLRQTLTPTLKWVRHGTRVNIKRPQLPRFPKAKFLAVTEPMYPVETRPQYLRCTVHEENLTVEEDHPYHILLAKQLKQELDAARLIAFYQINSITCNEFFEARKVFFKQDMLLKRYEHIVYQIAFRGTRYETAMALVMKDNMNCFVTSSDARVGKLLSLQRKTPKLVLLAGIVDDRLLSKSGLVAYSQLPSLDIMRAQVCATLSSAAQGVAQNLSHHQQQLSDNLRLHADREKTDLPKEQTLDSEITSKET